jgi:hypothetical protein
MLLNTHLKGFAEPLYYFSGLVVLASRIASFDDAFHDADECLLNYWVFHEGKLEIRDALL